MRRRTLTLLIIIIALVVVVAVVAIYGAVTHRMLYVPGESMMNTVLPGDRLFARKFSGDPKRGQIVVVQYPGDSTYHLGRVIGLPNETLTIRDTAVYINGNLRVKEQKVTVRTSDPEEELTVISTEGTGRYKVFFEANASRDPDPSLVGPYQIPPGHYFIMGDNRDNSEDSRYRGTVPRELIWGEAFMIYFSTNVKTGEARTGRFFKSIE